MSYYLNIDKIISPKGPFSNFCGYHVVKCWNIIGPFLFLSRVWPAGHPNDPKKLPEILNNMKSLDVCRYFSVTWHLSNCPDGAQSLYRNSADCSEFTPTLTAGSQCHPPSFIPLLPLPFHCPSNLLSVHNLCCLLRCWLSLWAPNPSAGGIIYEAFTWRSPANWKHVSG